MEHSVIQTLTEVKPQLRNEFDAAVVALHLTMRELGFRTTGLAELSTNNNNDIDTKPIPYGWNQSADSYSFQYKHTQSSMTFLVKYLVMNDKLLIHGIAKEDNKICSLEVSAKEYVNEKSLTTYESLYKQLDKLIALFKINITSKLLPDLNKAGYEATTTENPSSTNNTRVPPPDPLERHAQPPYNRPQPAYDPLRIPGTGNRPQFPSLGVGYGDLYPPLPGMGGPGMVPGGQGNLVGPNHPVFGPRVGDPYNTIDPSFPNMGPRFPRGTLPGARYDPVGPPPPLNPSFNPRNHQNFGDELPPPGYDNMYL